MSAPSVKRIVILTGNHLCHNPRVLKTAATLAGTGYSVEVLGAWFDPILRDRDQELLSRLPFTFFPVIDLTQYGAAGLGARLQFKLGRLAYRFSGTQNRWQLGYGVSALRKAAYSRAADLYIAHSEAALATAVDLQHAGRQVGVDMEDWFSEDLLPEARRNRPIGLLRALEQSLLRVATFSSCPSQAMSKALAREFGCRPPTVIYNSFAWTERRSLDGRRRDRRNSRMPSLIWYSQTIGRCRGLEDLVAALPHIAMEFEIHLRGKVAGGFREWLETQLPSAWRPRIFFHDLVPNADLLSRIAEHDIGFAGEQKYCRSRDLTVTNKILHYLLGGLAIVASDTAGQREIAAKSGEAVRLYPCGDAHALAAVLNELLGSPEMLATAKAAALQAAEAHFCWERQVPALLESIHGHI